MCRMLRDPMSRHTTPSDVCEPCLLYAFYIVLFLLLFSFFFFFNDSATTEIYTLSLHDALPISWIHESVDLFEKMRFKYGMQEGNKEGHFALKFTARADYYGIERIAEVLLDDIKVDRKSTRLNSSHVRISYAVFCLKKKKK